jgi:hypothetical protein
MRENDFEKRVREKMDQLGFEPSESVWAGVDKEINKEKKRRVPLFWLFFVSGLLLAGGAYYFVANKNTTRIIPNKNAENPIAKIPEQKSGNKQQIEQPPTPAPQNAGVNRQPLPRKMRESTDKPQQVAVTSSMNKKPVDHALGISPRKTSARAGKNVKAKEINEAGQASAAAGTADIIINNYSSQSAKSETEKDNNKIFDSTASKIIATTTQNKTKKDSVAGATTANIKEQKKKSSAWQIGYTAGAGSSNLNQNLFNSVKTLSPVTNSTVAVTPAGYINNSSSEIRPGFSFDAGAFVNRNLSKRLSFSAGINYHYYSTTIRTGMKINTTLVTYNSMNQSITATNYYENGNSQTFTNQYHFIEMPLSVNFQINKSKRTPFIWELGLTPGYIVGSNALYYDPNTNLYFNNYLQPNKMQVNGVTALMIGFPLLKGEMQIGPQLQYGFTGFVNTSDGNPGHLFYLGLKISFIPGKK